MGGQSVTYTPDAEYCTTAGGGPDTFTYTLTSGASATVTVNISCPSFDETIVLKYAKTSHTFKGDITSDAPECLDNRNIDIFKTSATSGDTFLASATTDAAGHYEVVFKVKSGKFYARLYGNGVPGVGFCNGADSPTIKVRR